MKKAFIFFTLFVSFSYSLQAQNEWLDKVDIYLHTVDRGTNVYDNFGHTAIRVHNRNTGQDLVYNWGLFDFSNPTEFSLKFYRGILIYTLGAYKYTDALSIYQRERRTVWEDKINFNSEQKRVFLKRLDWNMLPENRNYPYHYFFNNCSTIVRDHLNEAVSGKIKSKLTETSSTRTFRDTVQEGYSTNPEIYLSLDIIMNSNIDREMSQWEEMFLPLKLREHLLNLDSDNPFFSDSKVLYEFESPTPSTLNGFQILALTLITILVCAYLSRLRKIKALYKISWSLLGIVVVILWVFGFTMLLNWTFSGHADLHHNVNLFLLWPTDLLLIWPISLFILKGKFIDTTTKKGRFLINYIKAHIAINILFFLIGLTGLTSQDIFSSALYIAPLYSVLLYMLFPPKNSDSVSLSYGIN